MSPSQRGSTRGGDWDFPGLLPTHCRHKILCSNFFLFSTLIFRGYWPFRDKSLKKKSVSQLFRPFFSKLYGINFYYFFVCISFEKESKYPICAQFFILLKQHAFHLRSRYRISVESFKTALALFYQWRIRV